MPAETSPPRTRRPADHHLAADRRRGDPLVAVLTAPGRPDRVRHVHRTAASPGRRSLWPSWVDPRVVEALRRRGIEAPWQHQVDAAERVRAGGHVVLATGTASGKSLGYWVPALTAALAPDAVGRGGTTIYLSPTKALAADQLAGLEALAVPGVRAATYDGDTPTEQRRWVREHAAVVLTNPDMLHRSVLPDHARWASFLRRLRHVVVDEAHVYRGVLGAHVAAVLRRLRRLAARYGAEPVLVLASATTADPATSARALTGLVHDVVDEDTSARGTTSVVLWEPPLVPGGGEHDAPTRRPAPAEAADLLADLVAAGVRTLAFTRSRRSAETVALAARRLLTDVDPSLAHAVAAYRGGYLPEERRVLEADLRGGRLLGLATTTALELGVDVSGLDAVLLAGWPGRRASLWQQAGRAGRDGGDALAVLVARDDPLDTYLVHHPEAVFGRSVEATVLDPTNPYVLAPHLCAAAGELPLTPADLPLFGEPAAVRGVLDALVGRGLLRRRPTGWFWAGEGRACDLTDLRGAGGDPVRVVEAGTGRVLGTVDAAASHHAVHRGAVHLHQGLTYVVEELDLDGGTALVRRDDPDHTTQARDVVDIRVLAETAVQPWGEVVLTLGTVEVTSTVVSFLRRRLLDGHVLGEEPLDLPPRTLRTTACWWTLPPDLLERWGVAAADVPGAAHAAEHAAIGLLPLVATSDRWDVGGVSTALHPDTGLPTIFVHDATPGGAGFAERAFSAARTWLTATVEAVQACACEHGCPSCVQSPKCGNGNEPLDKAAAVRLLRATLSAAEETEHHRDSVLVPDGVPDGGARP